MLIRKLLLIASLSLAVAVTGAKAEGRIPAEALQSVVSVLPVWDGRPQGGTSDARGFAPEGSGVIVRPGVIATAWHVIEPAERIDVRLSDGRILPARLIAHDGATDVALLAVDTDLPPIAIADEPALAEPVCTIGNAFGLGLSVTCGVISALDVTDAGFNGIEDFLQTDAATNPGVSGGALVDSDGHLVGLMMAIFASDADANVGVNFAISAHLLARVIDGLMTDGHVNYPRAGWHLGPTPAAQRPVIAAPLVRDVAAVGPAADAGVRPGDLIVGIGSRRVRTPRDAITALAILPEGAPSFGVVLWRDGVEHRVELKLPSSAGPADRALPDPGAGGRECPHPPGVCAIRQAVFPISSFDPVGSATRIGTSLLVTNRHVMGDRMDAVVHTPDGPKDARVVASSYHGDLVLLDVNGLPPGGITVDLDAGGAAPEPGRFYAIGADVARQEIRVFEPGSLIVGPADGAALGRLHVTARMQPGVSGGALVDQAGDLVAIAVGGGDGRYEAIPAGDIRDLLARRDDAEAERVTRRLGAAFAACSMTMDAIRGGDSSAELLETLSGTCRAGNNQGQLLEAGRVLAQSGDFDGAIGLHQAAADQVPNSINARMSLLVSLQLAARFEEMTGPARALMELAPDDPRALRFSIQAGVWGGSRELAEDGYQALLKADPQQAQAARRFIDSAPPAPPRR